MGNKSCKKVAESHIRSPRFWKELSESSKAFKAFPRSEKGSCWDQAAATYDDLEACSDYQFQVRTIMDTLRERGVLQKENRVIDIACGTGIYALRMAPMVKEVVCLDISQAMLERLREKAEAAGIRNIKTILADWRKFQTDERFDLVFVSMTPLLRSMDNVDRFLALSRRYAVFISWAGIRENELVKRLSKEILGKEPDATRMDIHFLFNYLYTKGFAPDVRFFRGCWERTRSVERHAEAIIWQLELHKELSEKQKERVRETVKGLARDGKVTSKTKVRIAFMFIDKQADAFKC